MVTGYKLSTQNCTKQKADFSQLHRITFEIPTNPTIIKKKKKKQTFHNFTKIKFKLFTNPTIINKRHILLDIYTKLTPIFSSIAIQ